MAEEARESLARIELLSVLKPRELAAVERICRWKRYGSHEQIIDRHSDSREVCFVVNGRVRIVNYSLSGREITLDDVDAGNYFGELAAIDGQPRSAGAMALTETLVASLPSNTFLRLLHQRPAMALKVMKRLAQVVRASTDRIMDLSTLAAHNRVHAELLRQARANMRGANRAVVTPIPIHSDIASRVSTTRETVARVLNDLARRGIVQRTKDALIVPDVERLQHMVEEVRGE